MSGVSQLLQNILGFPFIFTERLPQHHSHSQSLMQSLSRVRLFGTPWTSALQASLSITNSRRSLRLMSIESVMPSNHLMLCHLLLLFASIFPSIRIFSNESVLPIRWPKYWNFSFSISPSNEYYSGLISFRMDKLAWQMVRAEHGRASTSPYGWGVQRVA